MLANILKLGAISGLIGGYFYVSTQNRIRLTNPYLATAFRILHQQKPQYTQPFFKVLLRLNILEKDQKLQGFILANGFDPEGDYIEQVEALGFKGMQVGPTSFNASLEEDIEHSLGIMNVLANICTYQSKQGGKGTFKVDLCIAPNFQILKYTPYLLKENLMGALDTFLKIQQHYQHRLVDQVTLTFQRAGFSIDTSEEAQRMISQIKKQGCLKMQQLNSNLEAKVELSFRAVEGMDWARLLDYIINKQSL